MTNIEFVTHSKYRSQVDPKHYENELLCLSGHMINGCYECTYIYTHDGEIIWYEDSYLDLLDRFKEMINTNGVADIVELMNNFPIYERYSDSCQSFLKEEYKF